MQDSLNTELDLPPEASPYRYRIAGHTHIQGKLKLSTLKHQNGSLLKPLINGDTRSVRELSFYQQVFESSNSDQVLCDLKIFLPSFHGTWETTVNDTNITYLCIDDVCENFQNPSLLDAKVGAITWDPLASEEKIKSLKNKFPLAEVFGFRILGMKVYDHSQKQYFSVNKQFGLSLTPDTLNAGLGMFFNNKLGQINHLILSGFIHKLLQLKNWFSKQRKYAFYSSSILLVYESNMSSWATWMDKNCLHVNSSLCKQITEDPSEDFSFLHYNDCKPVFPVKTLNMHIEEEMVCSDCKLPQDICTELQKDCNLFRIAMIDFAHVFPASDEDSNYVFGLNNIIVNLQLLLNSYIETTCL